MICRVCLLQVKKHAVICEQCSLIAHSKCAPAASRICDLRAQLLINSQYSENNNKPSSNSSPIDAYGNEIKIIQSDNSYPITPPKGRVNRGLIKSEEPTFSRFEPAMLNSSRPKSEGRVNTELLSKEKARDLSAIDGSAVRVALVVREEGKPPSHFVSLIILAWGKRTYGVTATGQLYWPWKIRSGISSTQF